MNILITESGRMFAKGRRFELYEKIRGMGHTLCFLDQNLQDDVITDEYGDRHYPLKYVAARYNKNPIKELKFIYSLKNIFKKGEIDCVLVYGVKIIPSVAIAAKLAGVERCLCVINGAGTLFMGNDIRIKLLRLFAIPMLKLGFSFSDIVFIQNQDDYNMLVSSGLVSKKKARRINGSGVNLDSYPMVPLNPNGNFLLITRVTGPKGIHEFIDAASIVKEKYPTSSFHLVGPKDDLDGSIDWLKVNSAISKGIIIYHGKTNDVISYIRNCRIFVFPSYYREGIPRAVLEAMSMGRPIITTDSSGCRETVINGTNGFLVSPKNSVALSEKMIWMLEHPDQTEKMGIESRRLAEEKFDVHKVNSILLKALNI